MCRLESLEILLQRILPQVLACPKSMVIDALQIVSVDFCKRTSVWVTTIQESVGAGDRIIPMILPKGDMVDDVLSLFLDASQADKSIYTVTPHEVILQSPMQNCVVATIEAKVRPSRTATMLPESIIEEWGDILAFGALAKLKSMSGASIEWTDPQGASLNLSLYENGCTAAKTRMYRKRRGGGSLYITGGE